MTTRIKRSNINNVPRSIKKATEVLMQIGEAQDGINEIEDALKEEIAVVDAKIKEMLLVANQKIAEFIKERDKHFSLLARYALPRKTRLTSETRTERTDAGTFGWRYSPPSVQIAEGVKVADVIADCERLGFPQFVRVTKTLDKKAIRAHGALFTIPGLSIVQDDEFFAQPKSKRGTKQGKRKNKTVIANM